MLIWIASALGLAGGMVLACLLGRITLPRLVVKSPDTLLSARISASRWGLP